MSFKPNTITRKHVLEAIAFLDESEAKLRPSTIYDVAFEGKTFPPKELLREAHKLANGERIWKPKGGSPTNDFLVNHGFTVEKKMKRADPFPALIRDYKELLVKQGMDDEIYKWQLLEKFKGRPDPEAPDFFAEIKSIDFSNLVHGPGIGVMQQLAKLRPDEYRQCFRDLYDENVDLQQRISTFTAHVTALYRQIDTAENHHTHHDERTIATILTYHDPYSYAFYKDSFYRILCKVIGEQQASPGFKYIHYLDLVADFIDDYIRTDDELIGLVNSLKPIDAFADPEFNLLAQDVLYRMLEINGRTFSSLIDEISASLSDDFEDPRLSVMKNTMGKDKNRDWVWVSDDVKLLNTTTAHFEIEVVPSKRDKIRLCLHFEDHENNHQFEQQIGKHLPEELQWFSWFKGRSLRQKKEIDFYGEKTVLEVIDGLKKMDGILGNQVRNIVKEINKEKMLQKTQITQPLNQILYGPPGTGKTYHTVNKALQLMGEDINNMSRPDMKIAFDKYVSEERIIFTSFHQSLSYEDFIEGLKPITGNEQPGAIQYEIKPGIFKTICNAARGLHDVKAQQKDIFTNAIFFKMSLGGLQNPHIHDWCIKNNCVALGWGGDKNFIAFKGIKLWKDYRDKFVQEFPDLVAESRYHITAMYAFQKMSVGDIVVISKGNHVIDAIGKVTGDYEWDDNNDFGYFQFRKVEWLATGLNQQPSTFFRKQISQQSIYEFYDEDVKKEVFVELFKSATPEVKPYVLIIDEINRGNISKIFGELITLLEADKRLENAEGLKVVLPYTRDSFGVPANLYIIGTMNTADRSVEALDTALRRRFSFEEMQPRPDLLSPSHIVWRFFWKFKEKDWDNEEYRVYENELFDLLKPEEAFKLERKNNWDSFVKEGPKEHQIESFKLYEYKGINLEQLLITVNKRLEILKDRDHLVGHAYFMNVYSLESLMAVFRDNLIPLLQEYFFGDYYKLQLVIGPGFIHSAYPSIQFAVSDEDQYDEKKIYSIAKTTLTDLEAFMQAIDLMKI